MTIRAFITIEDEGSVDVFVVTDLLSDVERAARDAAVDAAREVGAQIGLSPVAVDAISDRLRNQPESILWIEEVSTGSKKFAGIIVTAFVSAAMQATIGASIEEGWKQTEAHKAIVEMVPKIEAYLVENFAQHFSQHGPAPEQRRYEYVPVAIRREGDDLVIEIRTRPRQLRPPVT